MEIITLPLAELKPALTGLSKVVAKRPTLPILGMVKIERTADGWIALTGTDIETFLTVRLEQPAEGPPFGVLVPLEELQTAAKNCGKNEALQIHPLTADTVAVKTPVGAGWADTRCATLPVAEFPVIPKFGGELVAVPDAVRTSIHEAMQCASEDSTRIILNGAYLDVSDKKCHCVVGTDGRHLYASNSFNLPMKESVIIPTHRFLDWKDFNADGEWRLKAGVNVENKELEHLQLTSRRWRFITRKMEGNYPNWRQVIPDMTGAKSTAEIENAEPILQAIQRMPDHDPVYHTIGLTLQNGALVLLGKANASDTEWFSVPIPNAKAAGKDVRVNVNRQLLAKALAFGLTRLEIIDEMSPLRLVHAGRQMIVMPVRVEAPAPTAATPPEKPGADDDAKPANGNSQEPSTAKPATSPEKYSPTPEANGSSSESKEPANPVVKPAIEAALTQIETVRGDFRNALAGLNKLAEHLKQVQRENKSAEKEISSVRQTLRQLQAVRI